MDPDQGQTVIDISEIGSQMPKNRTYNVKITACLARGYWDIEITQKILMGPRLNPIKYSWEKNSKYQPESQYNPTKYQV